MDQIDWTRLVALSSKTSRGNVALRRLAALIELTSGEVPAPLRRAATQVAEAHSPIYLGERRIFGTSGDLLSRFGVVNNVSPEALREEVRR
jgi:hypothetical protein